MSGAEVARGRPAGARHLAANKCHTASVGTANFTLESVNSTTFAYAPKSPIFLFFFFLVRISPWCYYSVFL